MTNPFMAIDVADLGAVTGGADAQASAPNQKTGIANLGVTVPTERGALQIGLQGTYSEARTDYATCVREVRATGGKASDVRTNCGLPGGGQ